MSEPARLHRIDDWQRPRLPAPVRVLNALPESAAKRLAPIDEASLLGAARRATGLDDFGDDFLEPLRLLLDDLRNDRGLTPLGRLTVRTVVGQLLRARLRVEAGLAQRPELTAQAVPAPIVIVGLPRTGTTFLHGLLAQVAGLRSLPLWESLDPFPKPGHRWDTRRLRAAVHLRQLDYLIPHLRSMHEMEVELPHEELQQLALTFRSFYFEGCFRLPCYRPWYASADHTGAYQYLRQVLQLLQTLRGGGRWVLKSPQHLDQLPALLAAFPDAKIVRTHRDPARAVLSLATMVTYTRRVCYRDVDAVAEGRAWASRLEQMLRDSIEDTRELPPSSTLDIRFEDLVNEPEKTVEQVIGFAGGELDAVGRQQVLRTLGEARARHGERFAYRFEDLGLDPAELAERFRFYGERFDVLGGD